MSLIKIATNFKQFLRPIQRHPELFKTTKLLEHTLPGAIMGGGIGTINAALAQQTPEGKDRSIFKSMLGGAAIGGAITGAFGATSQYGKAANKDWFTKRKIEHRKIFGNGWKQSYTPPPVPKSGINVEKFFKAHGTDHTTFTTKKDVKNFYHKRAMQIHPDMGGDTATFQKFTADYNDIQKTPWFEKLAHLVRKFRFVK